MMKRLPQSATPGLLLVVAVGVAPGVSGVSGQKAVSVPGVVTCAGCQIVMDTVVTLGGLYTEGAEAISWTSEVAVDPRGRILVVTIGYPEIFVFDGTGRFLRTVGRGGEGPGEYGKFISHINVGPRYIHVFESHRGRTLLDHDFGFVRRDRFPGEVHQSFVTESDEVVFMGSLPSPASAGHTLHLVSPSGDIRSHGIDDDEVYRGYMASYVVTGKADTLWSFDMGSTRITRWDLVAEPRVAGVWDRTVDEWERHDRGSDPSNPVWPSPRVIDVMRDGHGLWIAWNAPDPNRPPGGGILINTEPHQTLYDGWVDLVDPTTGKTIARYGGDDSLLGFAGGSRYLVAFHETEAGVPYIRLLDPGLSRGVR